jgi:hypothetical protein
MEQALATARESLYDEMVALSAQPFADAVVDIVKKTMLRYRVQTKPGVNIPPEATARDALGERLVELLRARPANLAEALGSTIDEFRMQVKGKAPSSTTPKAPKPSKSKAPAPADDEVGDDDGEDDDAPARPGPGRPGAPPRTERAPDMRAFPRGAEPVAGGPRRRGRSRSECPKCHSMGVVLARSYAGDEYFSCIYCGWQAYKPADDSDPTASLAGRLLGQGGGPET